VVSSEQARRERVGLRCAQRMELFADEASSRWDMFGGLALGSYWISVVLGHI
jgi:hypothetical protein